jgi:hypothetical protein
LGSSHTKMVFWLISTLIDLVGVPESSADDIHWALDAYGLLDRMGFDRVHPCFWPYGFRRELREASLFVAIMRYVGFLFSRRRHWRKISWRLRSKV